MNVTKHFWRQIPLFHFIVFLCVLCGSAHAQNAIPMEVQTTPSVLLPGLYLDSERAPLKIGSRVPQFSLPLSRYSTTPNGLQSTAGRKYRFDFARQRNRRTSRGTMVIFWAFWCDTWRSVTRDLKVLRPQIEAMNLDVVGIAVDASQQPVARRAFERGEIWWPVAIDTRGALSAKWGVRRVPTIFLLDRNGIVRRVDEGFPGRQTFLRGVSRALKISLPAARRSRR